MHTRTGFMSQTRLEHEDRVPGLRVENRLAHPGSLLLRLAADLNCLHYRHIRRQVAASRREAILLHDERQYGCVHFIAQAARMIERHGCRNVIEEVTHRVASPVGKKRFTPQRRSSARPAPENVSAFQSAAVTGPART